MKLDASDPEKAAKVNFAAAWLFATIGRMNAFNAEREHHGYAAGYDESAYVAAITDARKIAAGEDVEP